MLCTISEIIKSSPIKWPKCNKRISLTSPITSFQSQSPKGLCKPTFAVLHVIKLIFVIFLKKLCKTNRVFVNLITVSTLTFISTRGNILNLDPITRNTFSTAYLSVQSNCLPQIEQVRDRDIFRSQLKICSGAFLLVNDF